MSRKTLAQRDSVGVASIAGYCMVSRSTVTRWIKMGKLRAIRLPSGHFRVSVTDFREFLRANHIPMSDL